MQILRNGILLQQKHMSIYTVISPTLRSNLGANSATWDRTPAESDVNERLEQLDKIVESINKELPGIKDKVVDKECFRKKGGDLASVAYIDFAPMRSIYSSSPDGANFSNIVARGQSTSVKESQSMLIFSAWNSKIPSGSCAPRGRGSRPLGAWAWEARSSRSRTARAASGGTCRRARS